MDALLVRHNYGAAAPVCPHSVFLVIFEVPVCHATARAAGAATVATMVRFFVVVGVVCCLRVAPSLRHPLSCRW